MEEHDLTPTANEEKKPTEYPGIPYVEVGYADGSHVRMVGRFDDSSFPEVASLMTLETAPVEEQGTIDAKSKDRTITGVIDTVNLEISKLKLLSAAISESCGSVFLNDGSADGAVRIIDGAVNAITSQMHALKCFIGQ